MANLKISLGVVSLDRLSPVFQHVTDMYETDGYIDLVISEAGKALLMTLLPSDIRVDIVNGVTIIDKGYQDNPESTIARPVITAITTPVQVTQSPRTYTVEMCSGCNEPVDDCVCDICDECGEYYDDCECDSDVVVGGSDSAPTYISITELKAHDKIEDLVVADNGDIFVYTNELFACGKLMGKFLIKIDTRTKGIKIYNLTKTVNGASHPHVRDNDACFGNVASMITSAAENKEYTILIPIIIEFLQTADEDDSWGSLIKEW